MHYTIHGKLTFYSLGPQGGYLGASRPILPCISPKTAEISALGLGWKSEVIELFNRKPKQQHKARKMPLRKQNTTKIPNKRDTEKYRKIPTIH